MFLVHRPSRREIDAFIGASYHLPLSYQPIGLAKQKPTGFAIDEYVAIVGHGQSAFERARFGLMQWRHFELGWAELFPEAVAAAPGTVVAVLLRHLGFWSLNGCRVVYWIGEGSEREFGFAYGTLTNHAEAGEEIFKVTIHPETGDVSYMIRAVSRPRAPLAQLGYPVVRLLQARFRRDSSRALSRACAG